MPGLMPHVRYVDRQDQQSSGYNFAAGEPKEGQHLQNEYCCQPLLKTEDSVICLHQEVVSSSQSTSCCRFRREGIRVNVADVCLSKKTSVASFEHCKIARLALRQAVAQLLLMLADKHLF